METSWKEVVREDPRALSGHRDLLSRLTRCEGLLCVPVARMAVDVTVFAFTLEVSPPHQNGMADIVCPWPLEEHAVVMADEH